VTDDVLQCESCGSNRVVEGPFYDKGHLVCFDCGFQTKQSEVSYVETTAEKEERAEEDVTNTMEEFPAEGFKSPAEAEAYLKKLQSKTNKLMKSSTPRKKKAAPPKVPTPAVEDIDADLIWMSVHVYQRRGSEWTNTLREAREEVQYRNDNIRVFAHEHVYGNECTPKCKEIERKD
jgi:hypothetical protein